MKNILYHFRTIWSILHTSPNSMLEEIILIDDFSSKTHLKNDLTVYLEDLPKVKLIRNSQREGLIRSRLIGAKEAIGDVLFFTDSHTEMNEGMVFMSNSDFYLNTRTFMIA